jgi:hypothetical protein
VTPKLFATVTLQLKKEFVAMKRALAGVLAIALVGLMAAGATAQAPFFQVYFDDASNGSYGETQSPCGQPGTQDEIYLVAQNWNMLVTAVDYQIFFPQALLYLSDTYPVVPGGTLTIGNSKEGNAISWGLPRNGFVPLLLTTIGVYWTDLCDCAAGPQAIVVGPYPDSGSNSPNGVRWPDYVTFPAVGMTSLICPGPVATQESTWGGIKALYR